MESVHTIMIGDHPAFLAGTPNDPFWQGQKGFDSRHFPLARFIGTHLPQDAVTLDVGPISASSP